GVGAAGARRGAAGGLRLHRVRRGDLQLHAGRPAQRVGGAAAPPLPGAGGRHRRPGRAGGHRRRDLGPRARRDDRLLARPGDHRRHPRRRLAAHRRRRPPRRRRLSLAGRPEEGPHHPQRGQRVSPRRGGGAARAPWHRRGRGGRPAGPGPGRGGGRIRRAPPRGDAVPGRGRGVRGSSAVGHPPPARRQGRRRHPGHQRGQDRPQGPAGAAGRDLTTVDSAVADRDDRRMSWQADVLGAGYEQQVLELGPDPDGEGEAVAVLVRRTPRETVGGVVLYVHGFADYFYQTAHYVSDLALYDVELERALATVTAEHPGLPVVAVAHSTGGLVLALWLDRRRARGEVAPVAALVLNSPWFDLQGTPVQRGPVTQALRVLAKVRPMRTLPPLPTTYGHSIHVSGAGEWEFDLAWKPLAGFPVTVGWLNAIRRAHARLHRGLDVGVPSLILRSER